MDPKEVENIKGLLLGAIRGLKLQDEMVPFQISFNYIAVTICIYYITFSLDYGI